MNENPLRLGPIVGHTDTSSSRVWIHVDGVLDGWRLVVEGFAPVPFAATHPQNEFCTGLAAITGLQPDQTYDYSIEKDEVWLAGGRIRTMPVAALADAIDFVTLSCDDDREPNAWQRLYERIEERPPRFILMVGDQTYADEGEEDLWQMHLDSPPEERRQAFVRKYEKLWAIEPIRTIMASVPIYMTWDDHDIRDGWGSFAADSATLAAQSPEAQAIHDRYYAYFADAADAYFHFQACRNPGEALAESKARPFAFRCGRLLMVVLDSRGGRDFARPELPVSGPEQWQWIEELVAGIPDDVDAIGVATAVPIVDLDPEGRVHRFFKDRTDDIDRLAEGDAERVDELLYKRDNPLSGFASLIAGFTVDSDFKVAKALGFRVSDLDDVRDKWSYGGNRAEQERLLRTFARACFEGRPAGKPRSLFFLGGDIHVGAVFNIDFAEPAMRASCVVTSGIAKNAPIPEVKGVLVDEDFEVAPGIHAELDSVVNKVNFAETRVVFGAGTAEVSSAIVTPEDEEEAPQAD
ncbi:MAG: alkaline phosphatase D family protein [Dehalococcoidia bacterium]